MISDNWVRERRTVLPRLLPRRLRSLHTVALVLVLAGFGWLGWLWYRSSSFVKVERVTVTGLSGPDVPQIRDALTGAARQMTTLHMNISKLEASVSDYAYVQRLTVTRRGAHDVVIRVSEQVPVALVETAGDTDIVNADGQLMPSGTSHGRLPVVPVKTAPVGTSVSAPGARAAIAVLAAAPYALLSHVTSATSSSAHGVIVQLRSGPQLYFGPNTQLAQKWTAALAVLRSKYAAGASYIDLSDPRRPAPGVTVTGDQAEALGLATGGTSTTGESSGSTSGDASQSGADTASAEG